MIIRISSYLTLFPALLILLSVGIISISTNAHAQRYSGALNPEVNIGILDDENYLNPTASSYADDGQLGEGSSVGVFNPYDPKHRPAQFPSKKKNGGAILSQTNYKIELIRPTGENANPNNAILRVMQGISINGCAQVVTQKPTAKVHGKILYIETAAPMVALQKMRKDKNVRACTKGSKTAFADITLHHDLFHENNIQEIVLKNKFGQDRFDVTHTPSYIEITQQQDLVLFTPARRKHGQSALKYWFYPKNTLILSARYADDMSSALTSFARTHDLTVLENTLKGFEQPASKNMLYVIDDKQSFIKTLKAEQEDIIGKANVDQTILSAQGSFTKSKPIQIAARKAGGRD